MPCFWTQGVAELAAVLGLAPRGGLGFAAQRGSDLLNRKTHFRQLAAGAGVPVPDGSVARTPLELTRAIERQLPRTGTAIVKQDDGAGGSGNLTLTRGAAGAPNAPPRDPLAPGTGAQHGRAAQERRRVARRAPARGGAGGGRRPCLTQAS